MNFSIEEIVTWILAAGAMAGIIYFFMGVAKTARQRDQKLGVYMISYFLLNELGLILLIQFLLMSAEAIFAAVIQAEHGIQNPIARFVIHFALLGAAMVAQIAFPRKLGDFFSSFWTPLTYAVRRSWNKNAERPANYIKFEGPRTTLLFIYSCVSGFIAIGIPLLVLWGISVGLEKDVHLINSYYKFFFGIEFTNPDGSLSSYNPYSEMGMQLVFSIIVVATHFLFGIMEGVAAYLMGANNPLLELVGGQYGIDDIINGRMEAKEIQKDPTMGMKYLLDFVKLTENKKNSLLPMLKNTFLSNAVGSGGITSSQRLTIATNMAILIQECIDLEKRITNNQEVDAAKSKHEKVQEVYKFFRASPKNGGLGKQIGKGT